MESKTFKVPNIGCDGCVKTITSELSAQPGIKSVTANRDSKLVTVQWDNPATWDSITATLTEIDYPPEKALMP
jgi:copper chaperone CopZ